MKQKEGFFSLPMTKEALGFFQIRLRTYDPSNENHNRNKEPSNTLRNAPF